MRGRPKAELVLTEEEHEQLKGLTLRRKTAQALALRARIVLSCAEGVDNRVVASRVFDVATPADGTAVAQINRAFERALDDATTQVIGWTLGEGQRDSAKQR